MIRKDKLEESRSDGALEKVSSDPCNTVTVRDLEDRALSAFSNSEEPEDK